MKYELQFDQYHKIPLKIRAMEHFLMFKIYLDIR